MYSPKNKNVLLGPDIGKAIRIECPVLCNSWPQQQHQAQQQQHQAQQQQHQAQQQQHQAQQQQHQAQQQQHQAQQQQHHNNNKINITYFTRGKSKIKQVYECPEGTEGKNGGSNHKLWWYNI